MPTWLIIELIYINGPLIYTWDIDSCLAMSVNCQHDKWEILFGFDIGEYIKQYLPCVIQLDRCQPWFTCGRCNMPALSDMLCHRIWLMHLPKESLVLKRYDPEFTKTLIQYSCSMRSINLYRLPYNYNTFFPQILRQLEFNLREL